MLRLNRLTQQHRDEAQGIEIWWRLPSRQFERRREPVAEIPDMLRFDPWFHLARPPREERHADAALGQIALDATEGTGGLKAGEGVIALVVRSVVAGENNERVPGEAEQLQLLHH